MCSIYNIKMKDFPKIELNEIENGGFFIVRYFPCYSDKGIAATKVIETNDLGFAYQNLPMGIEGFVNKDFLEELKDVYRSDSVKEAIVGLPQGFKAPLDRNLISEIGGIYIPKERESLLNGLSQHENYKKSLEGLKNPYHVMTGAELEQVLEK